MSSIKIEMSEKSIMDLAITKHLLGSTQAYK